jgi:hypothetical protein
MCTLKDAFPNGKLETLNGQVRWNQSWPVDDFFKQAVERCLRPHPNDRPTAAALLADFTEHFGIRDLTASSDSAPASRSSSAPSLSGFPQEFHAALLAKPPPPTDDESDESDIEMEVEVDSAPPSPSRHFVSLDDFEFDDDLPEAQPQASDQQGILIVIDAEDPPPGDAPAPAPGIRRRVSEILEFSPVAQWSPVDDLATQMKTDTHAFGVSLLALSPLALGDTLYQLVLRSPDAPHYILAVVHESGSHAPTLLLRVPPLILNPFNDYLMRRKAFAEQYPMFEGNFSLAEFTKQNRASPPPPGTPPLDVKVVQGLQQLLDCLLIAFRREPTPLLAEEARNLYQAAAFIIAKLKLFQFKTGFLDTTTIPITRNHHLLVRKAFDQSGVKVDFPSEPFNFDDQMIQKRLRPPQSNCTYDQ